MSRKRRGKSAVGEEDYEKQSHVKVLSTAVWKRSSMDNHDQQGSSQQRWRKLQLRSNSGGSESDVERRRHQQKPSFPLDNRSRGQSEYSQRRNEEHSRSSHSSERGEYSDSSEDKQIQRLHKRTEDSNDIGSELPANDDDIAVVQVKCETTLRKERRDKQKHRERQMCHREKQGQKAYYLHVNHNGKPYGDGVTAWKSDLNKLARGLDPTVMDVREQPLIEMATLRRRLRQNFEYSQPVDPILIRQLVGRAITQWRNSLWKKMDAGKDCPKGFDSEVWEKLEKTRSCPSHTEKSERMKHANSYRITVGRTGPCGEEGMRDRLRSQKGVSPNYDEVFTEMHRDKGYSRKAAEKKALKRLKEIDVDV